jgi:wyosine [tRNA(Phe)-imidazoG37] synthetase (radical SAM superfamily)
MATFLFDEIIFGPVNSRRLGVSLGINLLPDNSKFCTFDCVYCECGWTPKKQHKPQLPPRELVKTKLEAKLIEMMANGTPPNNITFAGNGEPTIHPDFEGVINDTIELRDKHCPEAQISVLSNATQLHKTKVVESLKKVDQNILKLDSAIPATINAINRPLKDLTVEELVEKLKQFDGKLIIQTLFIKGEYEGDVFDNTTEEEVSAWLKLVEEIKPESVMLYPIARDTPAEKLEKIDSAVLSKIAEQVEDLGINAIYYP